MTKILNVRTITKFRRSAKAISPVIATLLMIAIAVVASLVVYAWVSGYMGIQTDKAGKAISLPSFTGVANAGTPNVGGLVVYVQNVGQGTVEISAVYVDDVLIETVVNYIPDKVISPGNTVEVTIDGDFDLTIKHDIKVTTTAGTFMITSGKPKITTAIDPSIQYSLTVTPPDHGTIASNPDQAQFSSGSPVTLTATASEGYAFQSWSGNVPALDVNSNPVTITMDSDKTVSATFVLSPETLAVNTDGTGHGTVTPDVDPPYSYNTVVELTATPDDSSDFIGWTGDGTTGSNPNIRTVTLTSDMSVTAIFTLKTFTITPSKTGSGTISPSTQQIVTYGDTPTFTVTATPGNHITQVTVDGTPVSIDANNQYTFLPVVASHTIAATFAANTAQTLFSDNFDSYSDNSSPSSSKWSETTNVVAHSDSGQTPNDEYARFGNKGVLSTVDISCTEYNTIKLSYYRQTDNTQNLQLTVQWRIAGGSWTTLETVNQNTSWGQQTFTLDDAEGETIQIQYLTNSHDEARVDDVILTGILN